MKKFSIVLLIGLLVFGIIGVHSQDDDDGDVEVETETSSQQQEKIKYVKPIPRGSHHFIETFDIDTIGSKWIQSLAKKSDVDEMIAKYEGEWSIESAIESALDGDKGLVLKSRAKHHAISSKLLKPFDFKNKPLIVQYEVKFQAPLECGGAYVKLLTQNDDLKLEQFVDKTPYTIMFGPDKCGSDAKYHFILRYKNPKTGEYEEKHAKRAENIDTYFSDGKTHLYTLIVRPDNTYKMFIDQTEVTSGSLLTDLTPPINPDKEIVDVSDKKPEDWDDREKIPDTKAVKPDDWDENEPQKIVDLNAVKPDGWLDNEELTVPDSTAVKPDDWDEETDGEWEPPQIDNPLCKDAPGCGKWVPPMIENPKYKGKWHAPLIENPNYKGVWTPRKIPNPNYFEDKDPFKSIATVAAIGLELWSMTDNIYFDNFLITDDEEVANAFAKESWLVKRNQELKSSSSGSSVFESLLNATHERPWLWGVYLLVGIIPFVLIFVFCCKTSKPTQDTATTKKTDAETKDDEPEAGEQEETASGENEEENNEDAANSDENAGEDNENENTKTASNTSLDKEPKTSPRKRRQRKE